MPLPVRADCLGWRQGPCLHSKGTHCAAIPPQPWSTQEAPKRASCHKTAYNPHNGFPIDALTVLDDCHGKSLRQRTATIRCVLWIPQPKARPRCLARHQRPEARPSLTPDQPHVWHQPGPPDTLLLTCVLRAVRRLAPVHQHLRLGTVAFRRQRNAGRPQGANGIGISIIEPASVLLNQAA
jgi:hypothetical protein